MNIQTILRDCIVQILLHVDTESLLAMIRTNTFFYQTVHQIILDAEHDDIYPFLFRIKTLSLETLKAYLTKISIIDDYKLAHLMLATFLSKSIDGSDNRHFLSNIMNHIINASPKPILNNICLINPFVKNNVLIKIIYFKSAIANSDSKLINFQKYLEIWLNTILNTDQLNVLDKMYLYVHSYHNFYAPYIPWENYMKKYIIFDYVASGVTCADIKKDPSLMEDEQIKERLYKGDIEILNYYKKIGFSWMPSHLIHVINKSNKYLLYGGHLDLFLEYLRYREKDVNNYHELIITCLLRCNHVNQYKIHALTMQHFDIIKSNITFGNILIDNFKANFVLPVMTVATFKFCVKEFDLPIKIPRNVAYINAVSKKIWKKYASDDLVVTHVGTYN